MLALIYRQYDYPPSFYQVLKQILFGFLLFSCLFILNQKWVAKLHLKLYGRNLLRSHVLEISVLVNSSLFAMFVCIVSTSVIQAYRNSVMYDEHPIIRHCMSFGVSYFIYDIIAMFFAFNEKYREENDQKRNRSITLIRWDLIKEFIKSKNLVLAHHILIPALGIPVSYNANFKLGDFLFAVGFLMEASTPFVCMRRILDILGHKETAIYAINGISMTIVFFWCRIFNIFYIYKLFSKEVGKGLFETIITTVPCICTLSMLTILVMQIYWWILMANGCFKFMRRMCTNKTK